MTTLYLSQLVNVDAGFKPAVHLPEHFDDHETNAQLLKSYIPTTQTIDLLADIARSLSQSNAKRARMLHGTYGTGKSDLLLVICNYFQRSVDDPIMQPLYERLNNLNPHLYQTIREQRQARKPYLVVLLQADPTKPFPGFILYGLQQALDRIGLSELMGPTRYSAAIEKIENWRKTHHPILTVFTAELQRQAAKELDGLIAELQGSSPDSAFLIFQRVFHTATGTEFNIHEYSQPHVTYSQVARALHDRGGHEGIIVVCDEFTWFLQRAEQSISAGQGEIEHETLGVQDLANTAVGSGKAQIHFIISSLEGFASAGQKSGNAAASQSIERVGGRFEAFALGGLNSEELIRGALLRVPDSEHIKRLPQRQRDELLTVGETLWKQQGKSREWIRNIIIDGTFPLHPMTTYALPLLNRTFAQSSRTMFLFLNDEQGLKGFLKRTSLESPYPDWHNLLTLDLLFDYFVESIEVRRPEVIEAYEQARQMLHQASVDIPLAERVLKAIAVCELSANINLSATRERLRVALNVPDNAARDVDDALEMLDSINAVIAPSDPVSGVYGLAIGGKVMPNRLRRLITEKAKETLQDTTQLVVQLQSKYAPPNIEAADYNRERGTQRRLNARYIASDDLQHAPLIQRDIDAANGRGDGVLYYVVASSETERQNALIAARELTSRQPRLVIAVPQHPTTVLRALRDYIALQNVRSDTSIQPAERDYLLDTGRIGKPIAEELNNTVRRLSDERVWDWFAGGELQPHTSRQGIASQLASRVMGNVYSRTPAHKLSQHIKTDSVIPAVKRAVEELIQNNIRIARGGSSKQEASVLKNGLVSLGLLQAGSQDSAFETYQIVPPTSYVNSMTVWRYFEQLSGKITWAKLVEALRNAPYGMYDSLLLLFSACFFVLHADEIEVMYGRTRQAITVDVLLNMLAKPANYQVRLTPLHEAERRFLQGVVREGLRKPFDPSADRGTPLRMRVAVIIRDWLAARKLPQFVSALNADDLRQFLTDEPDTTIVALLLLISKRSDVVELSGALLDELPTALGAPTDRAAWDDATVSELVAKFATTIRAIQSLPDVLENYAAHQAAAVFGADDVDLGRAWNTLYMWRLRRAVDSRQLTSNTSFLFRALNNPSGSVKQSLLIDFPSQITPTIGEYYGWQSFDKLKTLIVALQKAFNEIETLWGQTANKQTVWLTGLARAASGRIVTQDQPEPVAKMLAQWAAEQRWVDCVLALRASDLAAIVPELTEQQRADVLQIMRRVRFSVEQWQSDVLEALPEQFGVNWRQPVEDELQRVRFALRTAATLDARLRQHVRQRISALFADKIISHEPGLSAVHVWQAAQIIPKENDLSELGRTLLEIDDVADEETLLTSVLPRALPTIGQPYAQWSSLQQLDQYVQQVAQAISEIEAYIPLTQAENAWLQGLVKRGLGRPLENASCEQKRLAAQVAEELRAWSRDLELPAFAARLNGDELRSLDNDAVAWRSAGAQVVLNAHSATDASKLFLETLPVALGVTTSHQAWTPDDAALLLERFASVRDLVSNITSILIAELCGELATIFGGNGYLSTPTALVRKMREWRRDYVLTPSTPLSGDARVLAEAIQSPAMPDELLLERLPNRLSGISLPFMRWSSWSQRGNYQAALSSAVDEIARKGHVGEASPEARALWNEVRTRLDRLSPDDRRWLIKMLNDELNV
jgi:hypothetical protein